MPQQCCHSLQAESLALHVPQVHYCRKPHRWFSMCNTGRWLFYAILAGLMSSGVWLVLSLLPFSTFLMQKELILAIRDRSVSSPFTGGEVKTLMHGGFFWMMVLGDRHWALSGQDVTLPTLMTPQWAFSDSYVEGTRKKKKKRARNWIQMEAAIIVLQAHKL